MTFDTLSLFLTVQPTLCPVITAFPDQALYIEVKYEAWFENLDPLVPNFKTNHAFTVFSITIAKPFPAIPGC